MWSDETAGKRAAQSDRDHVGSQCWPNNEQIQICQLPVIKSEAPTTPAKEQGTEGTCEETRGG